MGTAQEEVPGNGNPLDSPHAQPERQTPGSLRRGRRDFQKKLQQDTGKRSQVPLCPCTSRLQEHRTEAEGAAPLPTGPASPHTRRCCEEGGRRATGWDLSWTQAQTLSTTRCGAEIQHRVKATAHHDRAGLTQAWKASWTPVLATSTGQREIPGAHQHMQGRQLTNSNPFKMKIPKIRTEGHYVHLLRNTQKIPTAPIASMVRKSNLSQ